MMKTYHFGVPAVLVWLIHIIVGLLFVYIGYLILEGKPLGKWIGVAFITTGIIMSLYHLHIWFYERSKPSS